MKNKVIQDPETLEVTPSRTYDDVHEIIELAKSQHEDEGKLEIDDAAIVSEGADNGAYVSAWVWVDFSGTKFDKDPNAES